MATFPPAITATPPGSTPTALTGPGSPVAAAPPGGGGGDAIKLAMLAQLFQGLAKQYPQGQEAIQMMMQGLRQLQSVVAAQSTPAPSAAPPM